MSVSRATRPTPSDTLDRQTTIGAEFETDRDLPKLCHAVRARRRVIVRDVARSRVYTEPARRTMLSANARACQSTPIVGSNGRVLGMI